MKRFLDFLWPALGLVAVVISVSLLYREFQGEAVGAHVWARLHQITPSQYFAAGLSTLVAYAALAWYDRIALQHLNVTHISWPFISLCSFTTYALSHNIGASVFSGAMVRYRAYSTKGLSATQVAILVAFCSLTFGLGVILLAGLVLTIEPTELRRLEGLVPGFLTHREYAIWIGGAFLAFIGLYVAGSVLRLHPLVIGKFKLEYPRPGIMVRQLIAAPLELFGAAGIIYFALPADSNPGYFVVLGMFLASFSAGLVSNAPGGLGVFEFFFVHCLPEVHKTAVLAALIVFRLFYLIVPLIFAIFVVIIFESRKAEQALHHHEDGEPSSQKSYPPADA
ncbi:UPF0104 family protein [Methylovirgula sp. 4M-Z18]|uniref:UPF0104 family protein n=1 Tax=Methylovirgula sp. 4M-Z18 TaxID=2293567 RepID=UPI000E2FB766|nr:UPF0104 family protein [Methylovirgula sp. 4M-Z18]RFB78619.1 UPF0104 family protein [Methylovirgula sp. 4M-Z18]